MIIENPQGGISSIIEEGESFGNLQLIIGGHVFDFLFFFVRSVDPYYSRFQQFYELENLVVFLKHGIMNLSGFTTTRSHSVSLVIQNLLDLFFVDIINLEPRLLVKLLPLSVLASSQLLR